MTTIQPDTYEMTPQAIAARIKATVLGMFPEGKRVCTFCTGSGSKGMVRYYSILRADADGDVRDITNLVCAVTGYKFDEKRGTINAYEPNEIVRRLSTVLHGNPDALGHYVI